MDSRRFHTAIVSLESLDRRTAAGNHIEAVRSALMSDGPVTVCGRDDDRAVVRYIGALVDLVRVLPSTDIAYIRQHPLTLPFVVLARLFGRPVVLEVNGPPTDALGAHPWARPAIRVFRAALASSARLARGFVVPTPGVADYLHAEMVDRPTAVIPAGFDQDVFHPDADSNPPHGGAYVAFVGANTEWQGVGVLLAAVHESAWPPDVDVLLVGRFDDLDVSGMDDAARRRVVVFGRRPPAEVADVLRHAIASLSPKTYQTSADPGAPVTGQAPLKVYESFGCGTPCIVSDVPIQNELVAMSGGGVVVAPNDPAALATAVADYASDPGRRRRAAENAHVASTAYSWHTLAEQTRAFVRDRLDPDSRRDSR